MRTDAKQLEAYKRLARTPDGQLLHSQLAAELEQVKRTLIDAPMAQIEKTQGRASLLKEIVALLETPPA